MHKQLTILIKYDQGDAKWMRYPEMIQVNGEEIDLNTLREIILSFQPPKNSPNEEEVVHPFKDPDYGSKPPKTGPPKAREFTKAIG